MSLVSKAPKASRPVAIDTNLIARCGLYCAACKKHLQGRCPGCAENHRASWCKVRSCCDEHGYASCADCVEVSDPTRCRRFENPVARLIGWVLRSDRSACVRLIRESGYQSYALRMARSGRQSLPR